ncbi:hypothetical protein [Tsuneonella sp. HG222]
MPAAIAQAETFFLELAAASPEAEVRAWFESAAAGGSAVYATGLTLPREEAGVRYVAGLVAAGKARTHQRRHPQDGRRLQFLVVKRGADDDGPLPASDPVGGCDPQTRAEADALLDMLRECAEHGLPCPSLSAIADALHLRKGEGGRQRSRHLLAVLEAQGAIASESRGRNAPRVVTILAEGRASGQSTLGEKQ